MRPENANPVEVSMSEKMWGGEPFWGLGYEWDPDWVLTDRQQELRTTLINLCEQEMRASGWKRFSIAPRSSPSRVPTA